MQRAAIVAAMLPVTRSKQTPHPTNVRFEDARVRRSIAGGGCSRIRRPLPMTIGPA
jgi:hypothetical protein